MGRRRERTLTTVMFTDIVRSTELAAELGDRGWQQLLEHHHRIVRRDLKRFGGREIDTAGDGFFATFGRPTDAVRCACAIADDVRQLGVEIRAGVHTGEVEAGPAGVRGIAVHVGARVMGTAAAGEVVVSSTVRDLVAGSGLDLDDRGLHALKGVDGEWRLFVVTGVDGAALPPPLEAAEAAGRRAALVAPRRRPRRAVLALAGVAVILAVGIAIWLVAPSPDGTEVGAEPPGPAPGGAIAVDPETGSVEHEVPSVVQETLAGRPRFAIEGSQVWIRTQDLVHLDGTSGEVLYRYRDFACCDAGASLALAIGERTVWAPSGLGEVGRRGRLNRLDPTSGEVLGPIPLAHSSAPTDVAVGLGGVWVTFRDGHLERRDVFSGELLDAFDVPAALDAIIVAEDTLWVLDQLAAEVIRLDPGSGAEIARIRVGGNPRMMAADDLRLWVLDPNASNVTPVPLTATGGSAGSSVGPLGEQPTGMAVGSDTVWISDADGSIYRVDPTDGSVGEIPVGVPLSAVGFDAETGLLWSTVSS